MRLTIDDFETAFVISLKGFMTSREDNFDLTMLADFLREVLTNKSCYILMPDEGTLFFFYPFTSVVYEIHMSVLQEYRKKIFKNMTKAVLWFLKHQDCVKLMSKIPAFQKQVMMFAAQMGMEQDCILKKSFKHNNKLHDLHIWSGDTSKFKEGICHL